MMKFNLCSDCLTEFLFERISCPKCHSKNIRVEKIDHGEVVDEVSLVATPLSFPDQYKVVLFKTPKGATGFCRSIYDVKRGDWVRVDEDDLGPFCRPE